MCKILNFFLLMFKGSILGLANLIPGVSGGTLAVSMGIYKPLIHAIADIPCYLYKRDRTRIYQILLCVFPIFLGILMSVFVFAKPFSYLSRSYPLGSRVFFIGLIFGSLPFLIKLAKLRSFRLTSFLSFLVAFLVVSLFFSIRKYSFYRSPNLFFTTNIPISYFFWIFICGILASIAMVLPGFSGSLLLIILGEYTNILHMIDIVISFKFQEVIFNIAICGLGFFVVGVGLGVFFCAQLMFWLISHYRRVMESFILGLVTASAVFAWLILGDDYGDVKISGIRWVTYGILFILGFVTTYFLGSNYLLKRNELI